MQIRKVFSANKLRSKNFCQKFIGHERLIDSKSDHASCSEGVAFDWDDVETVRFRQK